MLNKLIEEINLASKANDGVKLAQLEVSLATYIPTLVEELTKARNDYANAKVKYLTSVPRAGAEMPSKPMSVAEATVRADADTKCLEDDLKAKVESANVILNAIKDQIKLYVIEKGLNQGV